MDLEVTLAALQAIWPILVGLALVIAWLIHELEGRMGKSECHQCRKECLQRIDKQVMQARSESVRIESALKDMRVEIKQDLSDLTRLIIEAIREKSGGGPHV